YADLRQELEGLCGSVNGDYGELDWMPVRYIHLQAQVLNLMQDLQHEFGITYMLISHDLAVVNHLCDEVVVLYQGRIVERGSPAELFRNAQHPYTQSLVGAVPQVQPGRARARRAAAAAQATAKTA
ncbi:hypothetical protein ACQKEU_16360, partial [Acidovorax sp. NPDC077664]